MKTERSPASVETLLHDSTLLPPSRNALRNQLRHRLWRAGELEADEAAIPTGHAALDPHLAGRGWPCGGLIELLCDRAGIGELRLMAPALATLSAEPRWILWLNPPYIPYAPALAALGIDVRKVLLVHPRQHRDAVWALEQALRSGTCSAALAWLDERRLKVPEIRKLKLAASEGKTLAMLFRPEAASANPSNAEIRIRLKSAAAESVEVDIVKRRGGWPVSVRIEMPAPMPVGAADLERQLRSWRSQRAPAGSNRSARPNVRLV